MPFNMGAGSAVIVGPYRYLLTRGSLRDPYALFVCLNPSTANAEEDDATIKWCTAWTERHDLALRVVNLFAYRTKDTDVLKANQREGVDIVGPENDGYILHQARKAKLVVCAWGSGVGLFGKTNRNVEVMMLLKSVSRPHYLRLSSTTRQPWHPLYLPRNVEATPYSTGC